MAEPEWYTRAREAREASKTGDDPRASKPSRDRDSTDEPSQRTPEPEWYTRAREAREASKTGDDPDEPSQRTPEPEWYARAREAREASKAGDDSEAELVGTSEPSGDRDSIVDASQEMTEPEWYAKAREATSQKEKAEIESGLYTAYDPYTKQFVPTTKAVVEVRERLGYTTQDLDEIASEEYQILDYETDAFVAVPKRVYENRGQFYLDSGLSVDEVKEILSEDYKVYDYDSDKFVPVTKKFYEAREQFYKEAPMIAPPGTPNTVTPQELQGILGSIEDYKITDPNTGEITYDVRGVIENDALSESTLKIVFTDKVIEDIKEAMRSELGIEGTPSVAVDRYWDLRSGQVPRIIDRTTRDEILAEDPNAHVVKWQPALIYPVDPEWQELKNRPVDDPERMAYLQQWHRKIIDAAAVVGTVAMPYTWSGIGWAGSKIATSLAGAALKAATVASKPLLMVAPRLTPVAHITSGMSASAVSIVPKLATSIAQLALVPAPAIYTAARVKDELFPLSLEERWQLFKTLTPEDKSRIIHLSGYDKVYEDLSDEEKAVVLLKYAPPAGYTLNEWQNTIQKNIDEMHEYAAKGADWLRENSPIPAEPVIFAQGAVAGVIEGLGYAANIPVVTANLIDKIPRGSAQTFAVLVATGMYDFFRKEIPKFVSADPTMGVGRVVGLFLFTPMGLVKFAKGLGYDIPMAAVKGMNHIAVSFNPLFVKPMANLVPKDAYAILDSIKARAGITKPINVDSIVKDFLRNKEGITPNQIKSKVSKLIDDVLATEGVKLADHERIKLSDEIISKVWSSTVKPESMLKMGEELVKQMTTKGIDKAKATVEGWVVEVRKPAYQQVVGDTYLVFGDKSRFPEDAPIKPMEVPYGRPSEGMAMAPTAVERFGVLTGRGGKVENPVVAMIHVPEGYKPRQLRLHAGDKVELESWLLENAYPVPKAKDTYLSPLTGEVYPVLHYTMKGVEWKGLSPVQRAQIMSIGGKEAFLDALLGWYGRQKALESKFVDDVTPKINESIKSLEISPDSVIGKNREVVSQIEALHPDRGTMNEKVRTMVVHDNKVLMAQDRADPQGVYDFVGGSMSKNEVLIPELGKWNWELPKGERPAVTWELGARSQIKGELDVNVPNLEYVGMYRGKIGEHAIYGTRVYEGKVDSPYFDNVKAWEKYQRDVYGYHEPEIARAMWWDGQTKIRVQPFIYDMLKARADKHGWDMSKVDVYDGVKTQNMVRDTEFAKRVREGNNPDLTSVEIKSLEKKWLKNLKDAYMKRRYGEYADLSDYLMATPDIQLLLGVLKGRRRAIQVARDKVIKAEEASQLLIDIGRPPEIGKIKELKDEAKVLDEIPEAVERKIDTKAQEIVDRIAQEYGVPTRPAYRFTIRERLGEALKPSYILRHERYDGWFDPNTGTVHLWDLNSPSTILHELVHPIVNEKVRPSLVDKLNELSGTKDITYNPRGLLVPEKGLASDMVFGFNELAAIEYVKRLTKFEETGYRNDIGWRLKELGEKYGIPDLQKKVDALAQRYVDDLNPKFVKDMSLSRFSEDTVKALEDVSSGERGELRGYEVEKIRREIEDALGKDYKKFEENIKSYEDELYANIMSDYINKYKDVVANKIGVTAGRVNYDNLEYYPLVKDYISEPSVYGEYAIPESLRVEYPPATEEPTYGKVEIGELEYPPIVTEEVEYPSIIPTEEPEYPTIPVGEPEYPTVPVGEPEYPPIIPPDYPPTDYPVIQKDEYPETIITDIDTFELPDYPPPPPPPPPPTVPPEEPPPILFPEGERQPAEEKEYPPGTAVWIQGRPKGGAMYKVLPPPYRGEQLETIREIPVGYEDEGWEGEGLAQKSLQVIGGALVEPANNVDLGWARVNVKVEGGIPKIEYVHDLEANVGERSKTVGMGEGQIPLEAWDEAKSQGVEYEDFIRDYRGELVDGEQESGEGLLETGETESEKTPLDIEPFEVKSIEQKSELSEPNIVMVDSWREMPVLNPNSKIKAHYEPDTNTVYVIKGITSRADVENVVYRSTKGYEGIPDDPKEYVRRELEAHRYSHEKVGEPKSILTRYRTIFNDLTKFKYAVEPREAMAMLEEEASEISAPQEWKRDLSKFKSEVERTYGEKEPVGELAGIELEPNGRIKKPKNMKDWWESPYYENPTPKPVVFPERIYLGHRLLPPDLGGSL